LFLSPKNEELEGFSIFRFQLALGFVVVGVVLVFDGLDVRVVLVVVIIVLVWRRQQQMFLLNFVGEQVAELVVGVVVVVWVVVA
jgi:hypothetical protein